LAWVGLPGRFWEADTWRTGKPSASEVHQKQISDKNFAEKISGWAGSAPGLSRGEFDRCVTQSLTSGQVEQDLALGGELGVEATPTVFVNGNLMQDHSLADLRATIESGNAHQ
jgi:hypothetical protein